jgi:hypothetical protein
MATALSGHKKGNLAARRGTIDAIREVATKEKGDSPENRSI